MNVTAIWLRRIGDRVEVLVNQDGFWRVVINDPADSLTPGYSHIAERGAMETASRDTVTG